MSKGCSVEETIKARLQENAAAKKQSYDSGLWTQGAAEHLTPDATNMNDFEPAGPGTTVAVANGARQELNKYGKLDLLVKQPGRWGGRQVPYRE